MFGQKRKKTRLVMMMKEHAKGQESKTEMAFSPLPYFLSYLRMCQTRRDGK
jgi:hypothetical protein